MNCSKRKKFSLQEAVRLVYESDDESFDDSDNDRDSNYDLSDATENYDLSTTQIHVTTTLSDDECDDGPIVAPPAPTTSVSSPSTPASPVQPLHYIPHVGFGFSEIPGIRCDSLSVDSLPVDFFKQFITDEVIELFVTETNRFAAQFLASASLTPHSRAHDWKSTDPTEMQKFLGMLLTIL